MTNCYLLLLFAIVSIVLSSLLRGLIIAGISSKSEVLSQLRAKEDSYTVLKGWNITTALGERNPHFYKNGPWVHITVEYATSTANFCPLSLSNSPLQACMTRQHISAPFFEVSRLKAITFKTAFPFLDGNCRRQNVIYQATVTTGTTIESYIGLSSH